jgi:hypothetical protein
MYAFELEDPMVAEAQAEWVERVLGIRAGAADGTASFQETAFRRDFAVSVTAWRDAFEAVGGQIERLRKHLLGTDDAGLRRIAEFGLNGITGTRKVGLEVAFREIAAARGAAIVPLAKKAAAAAAEFSGFIGSDPRIAACDACPEFSVTIGGTLAAALGVLERALTTRA